MEVHTWHNGSSADVPRANFLQNTFMELKPTTNNLQKLGNELNSILTIFDKTVPDHGCRVSVDDTPGEWGMNEIVIMHKSKQSIWYAGLICIHPCQIMVASWHQMAT